MKHDIGIVVKKVSVYSLDSFVLGRVDHQEEEKGKDVVARRDKFYFVHVLFLLMGLMHFIPFSFFITANAYWMYKFRNVTADITDTDARTILQTHFSSGISIINNTCMPVATLLSTFLGYKIKSRIRVWGALGIMSACFIIGTAFIKIDTDSWQLLFFIITMIILAIISGTNSAFSAGNLTILSKFPQYYMKVYLIGQGCGGLFSSVLQIISLAMGTSTETSALFYFISGSSLMTLTFILFYFSKYNELFNHYDSSVEEDILKDVISLSAVKALAKRIWSPIATSALVILTMSPVLPNITTLVVSENYGSGNQWSDKYFVPVITFFYADVMSFLGRVSSAKINKTFRGVPLTVFLALRMAIIVPLIYFCNAQPRHYLPVLFHHDWQYTLIHGVFSFSNGYLLNMVYLDVATLVKPEKIEDAYLVMLSAVSVISTLFTPIGLFSVDVL